jgi:uncharacterized membrane protein
MNKEARPLTQEQRKEFVQLLKDAKVRVLETFSNRYSKRCSKAWDAAVAVLMEKMGATKLYEKAVAAKKEIKDAEKALKPLGFQFDDDGKLELTSDGSNLHGSDLREQQSTIMDDEVETARKKYEVAILNVLATESVEEAKALVEPLV